MSDFTPLKLADPQPVLDAATYNADGLVTAIAQDYATGDVLMLAYMNADTLRETLETGTMVYWSRSRQKVWRKGESSGNTQRVVSVHVDCDGDAILFKIEQIGGAACHTGRRTCFYLEATNDGLVERGELLFDPAKVYGS